MSTARHDVQARLEQALQEVALATIASSRPVPPYPFPRAAAAEHADPLPRRHSEDVQHPPNALRLRHRWAAPLMIAAAMLAVTLGVSAIPALSRDHQPASPVPTITGLPTPQPSMSSPPPVPTSRTASLTRQPSTSPVPPIDPRTVDLGNAVIDIPATWGNPCSAGRRQFRNRIAREPGSPWSWSLGPRTLYANLDGQAGDEALVTLTCGDAETNPTLLLALKVAPDRSLYSLGVLNTASGQLLVYDPDTLQIDGNTVLAEVMGPIHGPGVGPLAAKQVRGYAYAAGRFVQVSGPTTFPPLPKSVTGVDLANTTLLLSIGDCNPSCGNAWVRFVNRTGRCALVPGGPLVTFTQGAASLAKDAAGHVVAIMAIRWAPPSGQQYSAAFVITSSDGTRPLETATIVQAGTDGISTIRSATGTPTSDVVTVQVSTAHGPQTRSYQAPQSYGLPWKRLS